MGIFSAITRAANALSSVVDLDPSRAGIASPWAVGELAKFAHSDIFGGSYSPVTRKEAMTLPPVVNGRSLIVGELAARPLRALRNGTMLTAQPAWLYRTDSDVSPWHRMAGTLDDLIFFGESLWAVERGSEAQITDAMRVPYTSWQVQSNRIEVWLQPDEGAGYWKTAKADEVVYFPGPFEGLTEVASRTIRAANNLEASWANRAATPLPGLILKQKEQGELDVVEVQAVVDAAATARRNPNGPVMYIPWEYEPQIVGDSDSAMFVEARNAYKLDIANFLGLDAAMLDAALPKASLNYETQAGTQDSFQSRLPYWTAPLEARLSMDDVCPRGQRIVFDFSLKPNEAGGETGPFVKD